jgi:hypothetical protein
VGHAGTAVLDPPTGRSRAGPVRAWTLCRAAMGGAALALVACTTAMVGAPAALASPGPGHIVLRARVAGYAVTLTATTGRPARMVVFLEGENAGDQQTHAYVFRLPSRGVVVDGRLRRARLRASLGAFGSVRLSGVPTARIGTVNPPTGCSGPKTRERLLRFVGRIRIRLAGIGTIRLRRAQGAIDQPARRGSVTCARAPLPCPPAGAREADISLPGVFLSVAEDVLFVSASSRARAPATSIVHTRTISQGVTLDDADTGGGAVTVTLGGEGSRGVSGQLTFTGPRTTSADSSCPSQNVARVSGSINGRLLVSLAGYGKLAISGNGSASGPLGNYRQEGR